MTSTNYKATWKSLKKHRVPGWFHDAKFGIFIHWGLYSVPAYAPTEFGDITELLKKDPTMIYERQPYAEWYQNSLRIEGSPVQRRHLEVYGPDFAYEDFAPEFNAAIEGWDPGEWADLFEKAGARYVVLVTKHHDGFLLWESGHPNPKKPGYHASRDIVGELTAAVRARGMRMGFYYSGALDWSFTPEPITDFVDQMANSPATQEYIDYVDAHWRELVDLHAPSILWNDIAYPPTKKLKDLFAHYYNSVPGGVVNDRWVRLSKRVRKLMGTKLARKLITYFVKRALSKEGLGSSPTPRHYDFRTPEYASFTGITKWKWETTRGIGHSFGFNRAEPLENYLKLGELVWMFVDVVSKNGNLLLNVGPEADGSIPDVQRELLLSFGGWLRTNGEGIYGTRPWVVAEGVTAEGREVRFTRRGGSLYAFVRARERLEEVTIKGLSARNDATVVRLLGTLGKIDWKQGVFGMRFRLPRAIVGNTTHALKISPVPRFTRSNRVTS
ncbi:MAG: alpha-L-fucosidase [Promethearchaeota archaeon]